MTTPTKKAEETTTQVLYLTEVAETLREDALIGARTKLALREQTMPLDKLLKRAYFCAYFKYQLSAGVAAALAANDPRIQAIYIYEPGDNADGDAGVELPLNVTVHLLVKVTTVSAALEAFISALDRALTTSLQELPSSLYEQRHFILNVNLVSQEDVELGRGPATLLSSIFTPPIKIWERDV